ncbi:hypothetical protein K8353_27720 [Burkholderia contaminans]|nr:hypothetical protein [Burkholderia contaminans]
MPVLQKANLGVAPSGAGGDDQRTANMRFNANVDVLKSHLPLEYTIIDNDAKIDASQVGTRFGVVMNGPGKTVMFPLASSVAQNSILHFFNLGPGFSVGLQPGDGTPVNYLNTGDWGEWVSDGGIYWHIVRRGRLMWDETVGGHLAVGNGLTVGGDASASGDMIAGNRVVLRNNLPNGQAALYNDPGKYHVVVQVGQRGKETWYVFHEDGTLEIPGRPKWFNGLVPWDSGNFDPSRKLNVSGRTDGAAPSAGNVGEVITTSNSSISLPGNRTPVGTTTLNLGPGEWDVQGSMIFNYNASGVVLNMAFVGVANSSGSLTLGQFAGIDGLSTQGWTTFVTPMVRFRFNSATPIWLNAQASANANVPGFGQLTARRVAA